MVNGGSAVLENGFSFVKEGVHALMGVGAGKAGMQFAALKQDAFA